MRNLLSNRFGWMQPAYCEAADPAQQPSVLRMSKETIEAQRRRRDGSGPTGRAEAPQRQRPGSTPQTTRPTSTGGGIFGSGSSSSGGGGSLQLPANLNIPKLPWWMWLIILVGGAIFIFFILPNMGSLDQTGTNQTDYTNNTDIIEPTLTLVPFVAPTPVTGKGQTWTVMLYMDADDQVLEEDILIDLNEVEKVGSTDRVRIVAQLDRFKGGFSGDGDWTGARRYYITQDDDLTRLRSQIVADLGEVNMADGDTLVDFITWSAKNFPADNYVLILSDHGMGWPGGWLDPTANGTGGNNTALAQRLGDMLYLDELDAALGTARSQAGIDQFEIVGMDACLMAQVEVFTALAPHARYAVASQEVEPALGWAYTAFLQHLVANPDMGGAELATSIVSTYINEDQRILDEQARREFLRGSRDVTANQLTNELSKQITLTAVDLTKIDDLVLSLNDLSFVLQAANPSAVASAREYANSFTNVFSQTEPSAYIDLGNLAEFLKEQTGNADVSRAADRVLAALDAAVIAEKHGPQQKGVTGIAIYFPNSSLYEQAISGAETYTQIASHFATQSLWDDFLAYHYTGRTFKADDNAVVVPEIGAAIQSPGEGQITLSPVRLSSDSASPGEAVTISADIQGSNIGYIYLFVGYYDVQNNSVLVADTDFLESGDTRQVKEVYYPHWSSNTEFTLKFDWDPTVFSLSDGQNMYLALFEPSTFGAAFEDAVYTMDGTYTFKDTGKSQFARLYFTNGTMTRVYGFAGQGALGAPREIIPTAGDTFTIQYRWYDLSASGEFKNMVTQDGNTLTFSNQPFTWEQQYAPVGEYVVGFIVEDLDGKRTVTFANLTVK
jgi:clostripain